MYAYEKIKIKALWYYKFLLCVAIDEAKNAWNS